MSANKVEIIQKWIETDAPFYGRTDAKFILNFLDVCDDDVAKAQQRISTYYQYRKDLPQLMTNLDILDPKHLKLLQQKLSIHDIAREDSPNPVVFAAIVSKLESSDTLWNGFRAMMIVAESGLLHSARFRKYGGIFILDIESLSLRHALQATPYLIINTLKCFMEGVPIKLHHFHIINTGRIIQAAINAARIFLPSEINKKVYVHAGSWECMRGFASFDGLPVEYGGTGGTIDDNYEILHDALMLHRDYLLDDAKYGLKSEIMTDS